MAEEENVPSPLRLLVHSFANQLVYTDLISIWCLLSPHSPQAKILPNKEKSTKEKIAMVKKVQFLQRTNQHTTLSKCKPRHCWPWRRVFAGALAKVAMAA